MEFIDKKQLQRPHLRPKYKGITLQNYLRDSLQIQTQQHERQQQNLYETSIPFYMKPVETFAINEMDEDNYDESLEYTNKPTPYLRRDQRSSNVLQAGGVAAINKAFFDLQNETNLHNSKNNQRSGRVNRIKVNNSSSPYKNDHSLTPTKNNSMSKTLYGSDTFSLLTSSPKVNFGTTTLYNKFLRGVSQKKAEDTNRDKQRSKKKSYYNQNTNQQLQSKIKTISNLETIRKDKYKTQLDFYVEGFKDKLYERSPKIKY